MDDGILHVGDLSIDRIKSGLFLYYLVRAHERAKNRDLRHRKTELAIKKLGRLNTPLILKHIDRLSGNLQEALTREQEIQAHQKSEEGVHTILKHRITSLEHKLARYLDTHEQRKKRIQELEHKITTKFQTKREMIAHLREDLKKLTKLYHQLKKDKKHSTEDLLRVARKIQALQDKIRLLH